MVGTLSWTWRAARLLCIAVFVVLSAPSMLAVAAKPVISSRMLARSGEQDGSAVAPEREEHELSPKAGGNSEPILIISG